MNSVYYDLGMQITWPTCRLLGFTPGFALCMASTVVPNLFASKKNVSPDLIVYSVVPLGHLPDGGGVVPEPGIQIT